jgi:hypothetical protein
MMLAHRAVLQAVFGVLREDGEEKHMLEVAAVRQS